MENKEYKVNQVGLEQYISLYSKLAVEFESIEMLDDRPIPTIKEDSKKDEDKEAAKSGKNFDLGKY